ncbi:MAG: 30S ribosome-binding factor RbfA [Alphaproteobacteria bacterium]|nr:30S ribosome-binding factor RbfA [Alphaproteobacteria bacterium]
MKRRSSTTNGKSSAPGQRQLRVGERIRHILSATLRQGQWNDPALENASLISVTAVDVSPDLKNATAYIMPLGGKDAEPVAQALNRATGYFRTALAPELGLRHTPKITFKVDNSFDNALHIESLLNQERVRRDVESPSEEDLVEEHEE